ncbi:hypothetical protein [Chryseobacterium sp. T1]
MKKILLATILISGFAFGQIERVVSDSLTKTQNYSNAISWASLNSKELRVKNIVNSDPNLGMVSMRINASLPGDEGLIYNIEFNLKIEVKDKKYKVSYLSPLYLIDTKYTELTYLPNATLNLMKSNLEAIQLISEKHFNDKLEWEYDSVKVLSEDSTLNSRKKNMLIKLLSRFEELQILLNSSIDKTMTSNNEW